MGRGSAIPLKQHRLPLQTQLMIAVADFSALQWRTKQALAGLLLYYWGKNCTVFRKGKSKCVIRGHHFYSPKPTWLMENDWIWWFMQSSFNWLMSSPWMIPKNTVWRTNSGSLWSGKYFPGSRQELFHAQHQRVLICRTSHCKQHRNLTCDHVIGIRNEYHRVFSSACIVSRQGPAHLMALLLLYLFFFPFWRLNNFIYKDARSQPWPDEKFLTELQVWLHPGLFHNYVIAQTASNSPTEEAWHRQTKEKQCLSGGRKLY